MKPPASSLLLGVAGRLAGIAGEVDDAFTAFELQVAALAAATLLDELDNGISRRQKEIDAYEVMLNRYRSSGGDWVPRDNLTAAAREERLSQLRAEFIEAHESMESSTAPDAAAMDAEMWGVLRKVNRIRQGL